MYLPIKKQLSMKMELIIPECNFKENNNFGGINIENTKNGTTVNKQKN